MLIWLNSNLLEFILIENIEFVKHLGIKQEGNSLILEPKKELLNHTGSIHAGAIYTLAESQSGLCLIDSFGKSNAKALLRSSSIKYKTEAKSKIIASCQITPEDKEKFTAQLTKRGKALIEVAVTILVRNTQIILQAT